MSRTKKLKGLYALIIGGTIFVIALANLPLPIIFLLLVVLFGFNRLVGYLIRHLTIGRRLLGQNQNRQSIQSSQAFLAQLEQQPWKRHLIWIAPSLYTTSYQSLAFNNIGLAYLHMGELSTAQDYLNEAISQDSQYPLPHYNLAIIESLQSNAEAANRHLAESQRLGFSAQLTDAVIQGFKTLYANNEPMADRE